LFYLAEGDVALKGDASANSYSETNVQVAGVDEGDIIETDGQQLYILTGGEVIIANAWPAGDLAVASRVPVQGTPIEQYLNGDRLTVISRSANDRPVIAYTLFLDGPAARDWLPPSGPSTTWVTVYDVSDPQSPTVVQQAELDGSFVESRRIDDSVFVVLRNDQIQLPAPKVTCQTAEEGGDQSLGRRRPVAVSCRRRTRALRDVRL
jgi:uncharacterized secreted protein with C-terminal beta-propeller domain